MYVLARQPDLAAIFAGWMMANSLDELRTQINLGFMVVIIYIIINSAVVY